MMVMSLLELLTDGYGMLGELYKTLYQILMTRSEIKEITGRLMGIGDGVVVCIINRSICSGRSKRGIFRHAGQE